MYAILHVIQNLGIGGAQTMMFELYHAIHRYYPQHKQKIIYQNSKWYDAKFVSSYKVSCEKCNNEQVIKIIKKAKNAVIIYHKLASSDYGLIEHIKKKTNVKVVVINHTLYYSSRWKSFKKIDMMVAVSSHMNKQLKKWYPKVDHCFIHNGVCGYRYNGIKTRVINKKKIFLTGRINRICSWKHSTEWLNWCKSVKLPIKMVHEYIGTGIGGRKAPKLNTKRGRNTVEMLGGINNFEKKVSIIKSWDIFLYETNRDEGISMAILEALACDVPVICSNHYGNKEIIKEGVNGYIFKDRKRAKEIVSDLISNPKKLKELKTTTKEHFKRKLDARHTAHKYLNIINTLHGVGHIDASRIIEVPLSPEIIEPEKDKIIDISIDKEKTNDKFSIITSSYNKAKCLKEWADSVLEQQYRPLEVIFADDCSTDKTLKIINNIKIDFLKNKIEFKFIKNKKRLYCGSSYRNLVQYATGSYFGVLDADDMLVNDSVEYIMKLYNKYPDIAWIYTQFLWCDEQMNKKRKGFNRAPNKGESLLNLADRRIHGVGTGWRTFNYKIERSDKLFGEGLTCAVDKHMCYRLEEFGPGLFVDRICYKHRGHPVGSIDSVSSTKDAIKMWKMVVKKAYNRRKKYNYKFYNIKEHYE